MGEGIQWCGSTTCASHTAITRRFAGSTSRSRAAPSSACSARTAPARRRPSRSSRAIGRAAAARFASSAPTPSAATRQLRDRIGIVLQESGVDPDLTVREAIEPLRRRLHAPPPDRRGDRASSASPTKADAGSSTLSGGQRRRLDLALGVVGDPELVFLDEPTTGFDPEARRRSWELIRELRDEGTTILLTTHYMEEAQQLADGVAVIAAGQIVADGPPAELIAADARPTSVPRPRRLSGRRPAAARRGRGRSANGAVAFSTATPTATLAPVLAWAAERGIELEELEVDRATLEDVYLQLTAATRRSSDAWAAACAARHVDRGALRASTCARRGGVLHLRLPADPAAAAQLGQQRPGR